MAVSCARCNAQSPEGKNFCGDCGFPLDSKLAGSAATIDPRLQQQVREIVKSDFRDQKLAELEITQAVASRLSDWAKLFAFFVGIPAALLLIVLGLLGLKTYSDFSTLVEKGKKDITAKLADAQNQAAAIKTKADGLTDSFHKLDLQLADATKLSAQVKMLTAKVDQIGEIVGFTASSRLTPELKKHLESSFYRFQDYLQKLGFETKGGRVDIDLREQMPVGALAYYDQEKRLMVIDRKYADDTDLLYREYMHRVLYSADSTRLPQGSDASAFWAYAAIESGLATYFPCSFADNPRSGEKTAALFGANFHVYGLKNSRKFAEIQPNIGSAMIVGTEIWGGAFLEIRQLLGKDLADKLLFKAWFTLRPDEARAAPGAGFVRKLVDTDQSLESGKNRGTIQSIFQRRGWPS